MSLGREPGLRSPTPGRSPPAPQLWPKKHPARFLIRRMDLCESRCGRRRRRGCADQDSLSLRPGVEVWPSGLSAGGPRAEEGGGAA